MRWLVHVIFIIFYLLVTFFGLGPVLFADGVVQERIYTALIVIAIYGVLTYFYVKFIRMKK